MINSSFLTCRKNAFICRCNSSFSQLQEQRFAEGLDHNQSMNGIFSKVTGTGRRLLHLVPAELHPCEIISLDPELHIFWNSWGMPTMQWGGKESQHVLFAWALQQRQDFE